MFFVEGTRPETFDTPIRWRMDIYFGDIYFGVESPISGIRNGGLMLDTGMQ